MLLQIRDMGRLFDITFWPILDVTLWGFVALWMERDGVATHGYILLAGALFWQVVLRVNIEFAQSLLIELWSRNLTNLISSPLTLVEWLTSLALVGFLRAIIVLVLAALFANAVYGFSLLIFGWWLVPLVCSLMMSGLTLGFFAAGFIIRWGEQVQSILWVVSWLYSPFCGVFYPVEILPSSMHYISKALPMTYVFEAIHHFLKTATLPTDLLFKSFVLNGIYLALSVLFFYSMYDNARKRGFGYVEAN
jgi:ABC-2 type transport system permease protein